MQEFFINGLETESLPIIAFSGYLTLVIVIGIYATRFSSAGINAFFIGGRKMGRIVVALSAVVSGRSAWLLLGVTGMAYKMGASAVWAVVGYIITEMLLFMFYARRLRRFAGVYDAITIPDFFAIRFNDTDSKLRITTAVIILIFMISYVSAQFVGGGKAFAASFQIEQNTGILITAVIVLFYTMFGGFLAVSLTDLFQAVFMIVALTLLPVIAAIDRGGLTQVLNELQNIDNSMIDPFALTAGMAVGFLGIGLGSPGNPHIIARYMSINDPEQLRVSAVIGTIWNVIMAWGALFIGLIGRVYYPDLNMLPAGDTENLYPVLAMRHLHPILFGVVIASIFAAIMSTADSQLLVAASSIVRDIFQKILHRDSDIPEKILVRYSRIAVFLLVVLALMLGFMLQNIVFWLVLFAWAGLGAALGPTSILALYWKGASRSGVFWGLITGTLVTLIWYFIGPLKTALYELVPAFALSMVVTILVSRYTKKPDRVDEMFRIMK